MMGPSMRNRICVAVLGLIVLAPTSGQACSIPVFRYALERWLPSPYEVLVYHKGPLTQTERKALKEIDGLALGANLDVTDVDLDRRVDKDLQAIWDKHGKDKALPCVI